MFVCVRETEREGEREREREREAMTHLSIDVVDIKSDIIELGEARAELHVQLLQVQFPSQVPP